MFDSEWSDEIQSAEQSAGCEMKYCVYTSSFYCSVGWIAELQGASDRKWKQVLSPPSNLKAHEPSVNKPLVYLSYKKRNERDKKQSEHLKGSERRTGTGIIKPTRLFNLWTNPICCCNRYQTRSRFPQCSSVKKIQTSGTDQQVSEHWVFKVC